MAFLALAPVDCRLDREARRVFDCCLRFFLLILCPAASVLRITVRGPRRERRERSLECLVRRGTHLSIVVPSAPALRTYRDHSYEDNQSTGNEDILVPERHHAIVSRTDSSRSHHLKANSASSTSPVMFCKDRLLTSSRKSVRWNHAFSLSLIQRGYHPIQPWSVVVCT